MSGTIDPKVRKDQLIAGYDDLKSAIERHLKYFLSHGVLAIRDGGDRGGYVLRFRDELDGKSPVRIKASGRAWRQKVRYGRLIGRSPKEGESLASSFLADDEGFKSS